MFCLGGMTGSDEKNSVGYRWLSKFFRRDFLDARCSPRESARKQKDKEKDKKKAQEKKVSVWPDVVFISLEQLSVDGQLEEMYQAILEGKGRDHFPSAIGLCYFFWRKDLDLTCLHLGIHDMCIG